jgi:UDP-N-acetylmuramyl pentapeptide phosphotransferase/UDP-N-acetylglucosamine-1-phosphate transferase
METLLTAFVVAWLLTLAALRLSTRIEHLSHDHDLSGPQKMHTVPVPRIGGIGILGGVAAAILLFDVQTGPGMWWGTLLLLAGLPAFFGGFIEDLTKVIGPGTRLLATAVSALLAVLLVKAQISRADLPVLDWVLATSVGSVAVTVLAVAGIANSINIIDGFNGLASMCAVIMMLAIAYVAFQVQDHELFLLALAGAGAVLGFFLWNFPAGLIFLGDGGAYFLGFLVAELGILLIARNPQVSPVFPLLVCIYPVFETVFSIYRRVVVRGRKASMPDGIHLHSLVFKRLMRWSVGSDDSRQRARRNSMTSPYLWVLCTLSVVPAMLWWNRTGWLLFFLAAFGLLYVTLYARIVRFRTPRWLIFRR